MLPTVVAVVHMRAYAVVPALLQVLQLRIDMAFTNWANCQVNAINMYGIYTDPFGV